MNENKLKAIDVEYRKWYQNFVQGKINLPMEEGDRWLRNAFFNGFISGTEFATNYFKEAQ